RVEIDELRNTVRNPIRDSGRDHAAITVADQSHVAQVFELEHLDDVLDVRVEPHVAARQMNALAEPSVSRGPQLVPALAQARAHLLPGPARRPGAVRYQESGHAPPRFISLFQEFSGTG